MSMQPWKSLKIDYVRFSRRQDRSRYIVERFGRFLKGRVIDVGCDLAVLRSLLPECQYTGIDVAGTPDVRLNLEKTDRLPFDDGEFDCVICADVLEHLDNLHAIFDELLRVTGRYVILSLPNNWVVARVPIARGRGDFAHYGLPLDRPADRHKWFFNVSQARQFIHGRVERDGGVRIVTERISEKPKLPLFRGLRRVRWPRRMQYLNRYCHTYWTVLEKVSAGR